MFVIIFLFFKQKTAYEIRISDWSSDVCSSDLLYEPIHGSAPDIAGQGKANPCAAILSAAMLLRHSLDMHEPADRIDAAVAAAIAGGARTPDLGGTLSTTAMGDAVLAGLA